VLIAQPRLSLAGVVGNPNNGIDNATLLGRGIFARVVCNLVTPEERRAE
jgi:hypothetical protein